MHFSKFQLFGNDNAVYVTLTSSFKKPKNLIKFLKLCRHKWHIRNASRAVEEFGEPLIMRVSQRKGVKRPDGWSSFRPIGLR